MGIFGGKSTPAVPLVDAPLRNWHVDDGARRVLDVPRDHLHKLLVDWREKAPSAVRPLASYRHSGWNTATHAELFALFISSPTIHECVTVDEAVGIRLRELTLPTELDVMSLIALGHEAVLIENAAWEMFFLRVFAVDLGVFSAFDSVTERQTNILNAFYRSFDLSSSSDVLPAWVPEKVRDRVNEYTRLLKTSPSDFALNSVGRVFEKFVCPREDTRQFGFRIIRDVVRQAKGRVWTWVNR